MVVRDGSIERLWFSLIAFFVLLSSPACRVFHEYLIT